MPRLLASAGTFWSSPDLPGWMGRYFGDLHALMAGSMDLLVEAERCARNGADAVCPPLAAYLARHHDAEREHPAWLAADMAAAGLPAPRDDAPTTVRVTALLEWQQGLLRSAHPVAILGYLRVIEGIPPRRDELREIAHRTGLPCLAFRTLEHHADVDPSHAAEIDALLDELPLAPSQEAWVGESALATVAHLAGIFDALAAAPS